MSEHSEVKALIRRVKKLEASPNHEEWVLAHLREYPAYASQDMLNMWDLGSSDIPDKPPEYSLATAVYLSKLLQERKVSMHVINDWAVVNGKYTWPVLAIYAPPQS